MVVAQQMQNGVDGQIPDLAPGAVAELGGLLSGPFETDGHVAQRHKPGVRVFICFPRRGELPRRQLKHRERQHVRRPVDLAVCVVDGADALVVRHKDVDLTWGVDALMGQRGGDTFGDLLLEREIAQTAALAADDNAMLHFFSLFQSGFLVNVRARSSGSRFFSYLS